MSPEENALRRALEPFGTKCDACDGNERGWSELPRLRAPQCQRCLAMRAFAIGWACADDKHTTQQQRQTSARKKSRRQAQLGGREPTHKQVVALLCMTHSRPPHKGWISGLGPQVSDWGTLRDFRVVGSEFSCVLHVAGGERRSIRGSWATAQAHARSNRTP